MRRHLHILPLLAAMALPHAAWAQDQTTETAEPPAEAEPAPEGGDAATGGPRIGGDLDLGETLQTEGAQQPATYIKEEFGDWALQCLRAPEGQEEPCQMYQLLQDENGSNVAEVSIFRLANGGQVAAGGTFVVPLETLLTQKLTVAVDGGQAKRYDFSFCNPIGCYARVGFTAEDVARFKAGALARVTIVPALAPDQQVTVEMSLTGFTAAYDSTSVLQQ